MNKTLLKIEFKRIEEFDSWDKALMTEEINNLKGFTGFIEIRTYGYEEEPHLRKEYIPMNKTPSQAFALSLKKAFPHGMPKELFHE